jgi:hypothetical protein
VLGEHDDHELTGPGRLGHQRVEHLEEEGDVGEVLPRDNLEIGHQDVFLGLGRVGDAATLGARPCSGRATGCIAKGYPTEGGHVRALSPIHA